MLRHGIRWARPGRWSSTVTLRWADGREAGAFLPKYLRENTMEAWDNSSKQRLDFGIPMDLRVTDVSLESVSLPDFSGPAFRLQFSDGHVGHFPVPRPQRSMWSQELQHQKKRVTWGATEASNIQEELTSGSLHFKWQDLQSDSTRSTAKRWIEAMHTHGVAMVSGMPTDENIMKRFSETLGTYVLPSVYGETFQIKSVCDPNNLAYSNLGLQMHTDLPFNAQPPGIQLFFCMQQADEGGESIAMDGFAAAESLYQQDPQAFDLLCEQPLLFQDVTSEWFLSAEHPTFELNGDNASPMTPERLHRLNFNERTRDSWRQWNPDNLQQTAEVYQALQKFEQLVEERSRYASLRLMPGEMICTDNWRVMHSRSSFLGSRHFVGAYLDWDAVRARWRTLSSIFQSQWNSLQN